MSKQSLDRNERYPSESMLDLQEQLAARFCEKRLLFSRKVKAKKERNIWNKENTKHKLEAESKMKKKKKTTCSFGFQMVLGFYALKLCPQNQTQQLIAENRD